MKIQKPNPKQDFVHACNSIFICNEERNVISKISLKLTNSAVVIAHTLFTFTSQFLI